MTDKPRLKTVKLLNDLADVLTALRLAGVPPDVRHRIVMGVAEDRIRLRPAGPTRNTPDHDWIDGRWVPVETTP